MPLHITPLHPVFAAEVTGAELSRPLPADQVAEIDAAMAEYGVLLFRGQEVTGEQQLAFARQFGHVDDGATLAVTKSEREASPALIDLANVDADGVPFGADETAKRDNLIANQLWHSDRSFKNPPAKYSILCGISHPADGGDTEFADERAAYDALPETMKARLEGLVAEHFAFHSRNILGGSHPSAADTEMMPPVHWPIVRTIPETGRKSLYIGVHALEIAGMQTAEARILLMDLLEHTTQREFVYVHKWRDHDVLMWDNRCVLHRGRAYDLSQKRILRRCSTEAEAVG